MLRKTHFPKMGTLKQKKVNIKLNDMNRFASRTGFRNHAPFAPVKVCKITNFSGKFNYLTARIGSPNQKG